MGAFRYVLPSDILTPSAVTLVTGSVDASYGVEYLIDFGDENLLRPTLGTTYNIDVQLDLGSAKTLAGLLLWSNVDAGNLITVKGNSAASWGSPAYTGTFAALSKRGDGFCRQVMALIGQTYRYFLISIPTNSVYPGVKVVPIGTLRTLTGFGVGLLGRQFLQGQKESSHRNEVILTTAAMHRWGYDLGRGVRSRVLPLMFADTDYDALRTWFELTGRTRVMPFWPDDSTTEGQLVRVGLNGDMTTGVSINTQSVDMPEVHINKLSVNIEQITAGQPEWS